MPEFLPDTMITYLSFLALSVLSGVGACPAGWLGDGGVYCYLVSNDHMNWFAAQQVNSSVSHYLSQN